MTDPTTYPYISFPIDDRPEYRAPFLMTPLLTKLKKTMACHLSPASGRNIIFAGQTGSQAEKPSESYQ